MKKIIYTIFLLAVFGLAWTVQSQAQKPEMVVGAYVTSWTDEVPDPDVMTHINYAFGHVNDSFDGVRIDKRRQLIYRPACGHRDDEHAFARVQLAEPFTSRSTHVEPVFRMSEFLDITFILLTLCLS